MRLAGFKAAVTGGASGIGAGIGQAFAKEGADVAFLDANYTGALEQAEKAARDFGGDCFAHEVDVTKKDSVNAVFLAIEKKFGYLDTLVCSAGVSVILPCLDCGEDIWDLTIDVNLKGSFFCAQGGVKLMLERNGGSIICLSSQSGKVGASQYQAYCASKFGVIGLVQSLALEFAGNGIRVNALCPGVVYTPMWDKQVSSYGKKRGLKDEEVMPYFQSKIPLGRLGEIDDVTSYAVFLASGESSYITGQALNISGGQVMF